MKYIYTILAAVCLAILVSCGAGGKTGTSSSLQENFSKDASYALGMNIGTGLRADDLYPNFDEFIQGMKDVMEDSPTRFSLERAYQILTETFSSLTEERDMETRQLENEYLVENSRRPGIIVTESGLQYEIIEEGIGAKPTAFDTVRVHYEGSLTNGIIFDSSYARGEPIEFPLNGVIPGWTEGLQLMGIGSKYRLTIPSDLGYGPQGAGSQIPPYSTLVFEVELLDILR